MSFISIKNLSKRYGLVKAIKDISFDVEEGAAFALIGPNGAGKTSLVKSILGLVNYKGDISINGINTSDPKARKTMAYLQNVGSTHWFFWAVMQSLHLR